MNPVDIQRDIIDNKIPEIDKITKDKQDIETARI